MTLDDVASEREEQFREAALRSQALQALQAVRNRVSPKGACHYCGETELPHHDALFCCPECQQDWGRKERARKISGVL